MEFEEKVKKVEHVFDGKIIDLDIETIELPNGKEAKREIIRHQGAVADVEVSTNTTLISYNAFRLRSIIFLHSPLTAMHFCNIFGNDKRILIDLMYFRNKWPIFTWINYD